MTELELYEIWRENATEDKDLIQELEAIKGDNDAIMDRFYRNLEFGTGGLRGVITSYSIHYTKLYDILESVI